MHARSFEYGTFCVAGLLLNFAGLLLSFAGLALSFSVVSFGSALAPG